ncbi:non-ribosomal peptide synthetase [Niallia sp. NCCP-28]|uniref:amino acid adenylation domain-containing protein n=1 Tax=Niallia sp. NCCP-28 TaxID=2934712 RepID=UPI00208ADC05|nr:non-ribosomal peptide synthetase [Niallia sp. NCCP-28]GKU83911.1 non-ribosomal peptide synthetase [Niallia sp. NCCP-28]
MAAKTYPLPDAALGIWYAQHMTASSLYNTAEYVRLHGNVHVDILLTAVKDTIASAQALHIECFEQDGQVWHRLKENTSFSCEHQQCKNFEKAKSIMYKDVEKIIQLTDEPLVRAILFTENSQLHYLYLRIHHLVSDAYSFRLIYQQIAERYHAYLNGQAYTKNFGEYANVLKEEQQYKLSEQYKQDQTFWFNELTGIDIASLSESAHLDIGPTFLHESIFEKECWEKAQQVAKQLKVNVQHVVTAAVAAFTKRLTNAPSVVLGIPMMGRFGSKTANVPCTKVNTIPFRMDFTVEQTFEHIVLETKRKMTLVTKHQYYRHEQIRRDLHLNPEELLFGPQVNFMPFYEDLHFGQTIGQIEKISTGAVEDIAFNIYRTAEGMRLDVAANSNRYSELKVKEHAHRFMRFFKQLLNNQEHSIFTVDYLSDEERGQILMDWNDTNSEVEYKNLSQSFEAQASRTPDAIAIQMNNQSITYRQLMNNVNNIAAFLLKKGIGSEQFVGICMDRSIEMISSMLAVLKTGAAYVPLDPAYPKDRLNYMIEDSQPAIILINFEELPFATQVMTVNVQNLRQDRAKYEFEFNHSPRQAAYMIYTSGSTGKPKGVVIEMASLMNFLKSMQYTFNLDEKEKLLAVTTISFDISALEIYLPLLNGASVVLAAKHEIQDPQELASIIEQKKITMMQATPIVWQYLVKYSPNSLKGLRVLVGGEALSISLANELGFAGAAIHNMYGPTETTIWSTTMQVPSENQHVPALGKPIKKTQLYVLDSMLQPVPPDVIGELYIAGQGVARGYHKRQVLTAERFVANPYGPSGSRMYRTGDLVKWNTDGTLHYISRTDHQTKIRGFRIELGEIEAEIAKHQAVEQVAVTVREDVPGDKRIVAYIVGSIHPQELMGTLKQELPEYMVPSFIVPIDAMPLTNNGKIDRKQLPQPFVDTQQKKAPQSFLERTLCTLFEEVLSIEQVGVDEDFFHLGGHSILATQLLLKIRQQLQTNITISAIFENSTVELLARKLQQQHVESKPVTIQKMKRPNRIPLSFNQRSLWFLHQLEGPSATYNIPLVLTFKRKINVAKFQGAVQAVANRHDILRTKYPASDGVPYQLLVEEPVHFNILTVEKEDEAYEVEQATRYAFDLQHEVGFKVTIINEMIAVFVMHHISSDGWSLATLMHDLQTAYDGSLTPLPIQYADFALWQQHLLESKMDDVSLQDRELLYWKKQLEGIPDEIELLADRKRKHSPQAQGDVLKFVIPSELHKQLLQLAKDYNVTLYMILLGAFSAMATKLGAGEDIVVGSPFAGREDEETLDLIGMFINTLVMRVDTSNNPRFEQLIERVRSTSIGAYEHQHVPFDRLVEQINPERMTSRHPLFQIMFALQNTPMPSLTIDDNNADMELYTVGLSKFDLSIEMRELYKDEMANGIETIVEFKTDLYDLNTVEMLMHRFQMVLSQLQNNPRIEDLCIITEQERQQTIIGWNTGTIETKPSTIVEQFEQQAAIHPKSVAVSYNGDHLTYEQLNQKANCFARYLIAKGVKAESFVPLLLPRSLDMLVGIMAVLKTGAGYVPIDPSYPKDRMEYIINDVQPSIVVTANDMKLPIEMDEIECIYMDLETIGNYDHSNIRQAERNTPLNCLHPAYIIYTSGSTGRPKGVVVPHQNVIRLLHATNSWFAFNERDVWTLFHSYAFDFSVWEIWGALLYGGELVVVPHDVSRSPQQFLQLLADANVTVLNQTPSAFYQLMQADRDHPELSRQLSLRYIVFGGESLDFNRLEDWYSRHPDNKPELVNMYGITETTVHVSYVKLNKELVKRNANSLIGVAIPDLDVYVLDAKLQPVPPNVIGEMYVAGEGLARGYFERKALTAERFIANPYGKPGSRMYRTGDLARWTKNGELDYIGRIDHQVKIRGFRIELGEIENVLLKHPQIAQVAVIVREDVPGDLRLAAYMVQKQDQIIDATSIRQFAAGDLPDYMIPSTFTVIEEIPLTTNGKLNKNALPLPDTSLKEMILPRNPQEELLCEIYKEVLNVPQMGIEDGFFDLGGHSLLAVQLIGRIKEAFGKELNIGHLFEAPTVARLTEKLNGDDEPNALDILLPLRQGEKPLYCIHPAGGLSWCYAGLLKTLPTNIAIYGLQAKGIGKKETLPKTLAEMAAGYIDTIQQLQPEGPYRLLGWSLGGNVVQEMAVQLQQRGHKVEQLIIFDAYPISFTPPFKLSEDQEALVALLALGGYDPEIDAELTQEFVIEQLQAEGSALASLSGETIMNLKEVYKNSIRLLKEHEAACYQGDALFFKSTIVPDGIPNVDAQIWAPFITGQIKSYDIACRHKDMCQPIPLAEIGKLVKEALTEKEGEEHYV